MSEFRPIPVPLVQRLRDLRGIPLTIGVWAVAVAVLVSMLAGRTGGVDYVGIARVSYHEVAPSVEGRVDQLAVELYEHVEAGDIVATLDASPVQARLQTAEAVLRQIGAELRIGAGTDSVRERLGLAQAVAGLLEAVLLHVDLSECL